MKLTVFQADKGDCLLITGQDGKHILADGGMKGSYQDYVRPAMGGLSAAGEEIDLVYLSHIDRDHIGGVLQLMDDAVDWRVYDYQTSLGNSSFRKPKFLRPPHMKTIWHNNFKDQVQDNSGAIETQLAANSRLLNMNTLLTGEKKMALAEMAENYSQLTYSVKDGLELSQRVGKNQLGIPVNPQFNGGLIYADEAPPSISIGGMDLYVIGPFKEDLEKLRQEWNDWLKANQDIVAEVRAEAKQDAEDLPMMDEGQWVLSSMLTLAAKLGDRDKVTTPNLASVMLLVEETGKTVLMTGDGHWEDILKGLDRQHRFDSQDRLHVDVLKVQHHGSEHNIHEDFCKRVTADHYIFCGNGAHENPNLDVLQMMIDTRLSLPANHPQAGKKFKFWFNSSVNYAGTEDREKHMQAVKDLVDEAARKSGRKLHYRFLTRGSKQELTI
ncbi:MAG: MBL fold metallo-hydrolase [Anaerolineales bacterium]|jgi:beta-lactamase superfamily II metal-dependent hydrolase